MYDNSNYAYIVGRLRALETKMLNHNLVERLMDAPDADSAFKVSNDIPLVMHNLGDYSVKDFNKVLVKTTSEMKNAFLRMAPYSEVLNFIWYKYDFHNLKVVLKAKLTQRGYDQVEHAISPLGTVNLEDWQKYLLEDIPIKLTEGLNKFIAYISEVYKESNDLQEIDQIIDKHYLSVLKGITDDIKSPMISEYLRRIIDFSNLSAFVRITEMNKDTKYLESVLLSGGHAPISLFLDNFEKGYEDLQKSVSKMTYVDDLTKTIDVFLDKKSLISLEKKTAMLQQDFMTSSNGIAFGPEPVFAFFWKFENQLQIIKAILVGKLNSLPAEEIEKNVLAL